MTAPKSSKATKQSRSDSLTIRLDPKLKYMAEIAARRQRRTLTSLVEWALEKTLREIPISPDTGENASIWDYASTLWDIEPSDRFWNLSSRFPELLTFEEQRMKKAIETFKVFQVRRGADGMKIGEITYSFIDDVLNSKSPNREVIAACWDVLVEYGTGNATEAEVKDALVERFVFPF